MEIGYVKNREITEEMKESYLDYAMSVIISRALPDVRDGLKPVHRRILFTMNELGLHPSARFRKSAAVVGDCIAKYHPHGDIAVYDSLVRMAQDFSLRYPLVKGQGNFGSIDGDRPAAYRYTESRLTPMAEELLTDIDKDTVDFIPNYDSTRKEPVVLPSRIPNLLINGSMGIAVGMATNIPPHNIGEVINALIALIDNPNLDIKDLTGYIHGPDFPTGGIIYGQNDILNAYATGKGPVVVRAKANIEEVKRGFQIIVSEIPYQVNKSELIIKIAELAKEKKVEGIRDIRDESDRDGIRIVIELKQDSFPRKVLNQLFKYSDLQKTFHFNIVALLNGIQPQILTLKVILEKFIEHRKEVVTRRTKFELLRAKERAHILEGLKKALDNIDKVIETIKKSESREAAHKNLMKKFKLTDKQSQAILEMRLQTLAGLERKKILDELTEKKRLIEYLEGLLKSPKKIMEVLRNEFGEIKDKYTDERKTKVVKSALREIGEEELMPEENVLFVLTKDGYIKRMSPQELKVQHRGGKGLIGMTTKEEDIISHFFLANTHDTILFFTNSGKVFQARGYEIPEATRVSRGKALVNFLQIGQQESVTALVPVPKTFFNSKKNGAQQGSPQAKSNAGNSSSNNFYLFMTTKEGVVKKVPLSEFLNIRKSGMVAIKLHGNDELRWVRRTSGSNEIILVTSDGNAIRFKEKDVRSMGRNAAGVTGIRLSKVSSRDSFIRENEVIGMEVIVSKEETKLLIVAENGYGKKTDLKHYKVQRRGGRGVKTAKITAKTGKIVSAQITNLEQKEIIVISRKGQIIRTKLGSVPVLSRATQGVRIMRLGSGDKIASIVVA